MIFIFRKVRLILFFCAEVLEHIPPNLLERACAELARVAKSYVIIGVPYKQDIRYGRTTCIYCGGKNPPWGHVNSFEERTLEGLFPSLRLERLSYLGMAKSSTNFASVFLMDLAGNPYGTYSQEETCICCGKFVGRARERNRLEKVSTKLAICIHDIQNVFLSSHPNWLHVLFKKAVGT